MRPIMDALWVIAYATAVLLGLLLAASLIGAFVLTALIDLNLVDVHQIPYSLLNFNILCVMTLIAAYVFVRHSKRTSFVAPN